MSGSRGRGWRLPAAASAFALLGACGTGLLPGQPDLQPVLGYWVPPEQPDAIGVQFSGCDAAPAIVIDETDTEVWISIADGGGCEPLHHLVLPLERPLGDRAVMDGDTRRPVRESQDVGDP